MAPSFRATPHVPTTPRPPLRSTISANLKKAGGRVVEATGAIRVKLSKAASRGFKAIKKRLGLDGTQDVGAGNKENPTEGDNRTPEQKTKQNENDPNSQHSAEGKKKTKDSFMEKAAKYGTAGLMALPFAFILAGVIQGAIDCDNIDKMTVNITDINSSAWPEYPDWWPDWAPTPQADKDKVWISYSPAVHLLKTDTIKISTSNVSGVVDTSITGEHGIENNDDDAMTQIKLVQAFDPSEDFSNITATFDISTNCEDRMAYAVGKDVKATVDTAKTGLGAFADAIPWRTILYVIIFIAAVVLFMKGIAILRS